MPPYGLTPQSEEDLKAIARYTLKQWGKKQSMHYAGLLEKHFREIASKAAYSRSFSERYPQVMVNHCEHHYPALFMNRRDDCAEALFATHSLQ